MKNQDILLANMSSYCVIQFCNLACMLQTVKNSSYVVTPSLNKISYLILSYLILSWDVGLIYIAVLEREVKILNRCISYQNFRPSV